MTTKVNKNEKKFRTAYGEHLKVQTVTTGTPRTQQQFVADADINNILARFKKTGQIDPELFKKNAQFGDYSEIASYQDALHKVHQAEELFAALPSRVRERFRNDPSAFVAFATDPKNQKELVELGLAEKRAEEAPRPSKQDPKKDPAPDAGTPAAGGGSGKP